MFDFGLNAYIENLYRQTPLNQKADFELFTAGLLDWKEFADKLNWVFKYIDNFRNVNEIQQVISIVNKSLNSLFNAQKVKLWIVEAQTSTLWTTYDD